MAAISPADMAAWVRDYEARDPRRWIVDVDPAEVERIALARHRKGQGRAAHVVDPLDGDRAGALGELASSKRLGLAMPEIVDAGSDGGIDFRVYFPSLDAARPPRMVTIDVKTNTKTYPEQLLLVQKDKLMNGAQWFILARRLSDYRAQLLGWESKSCLSLTLPRDFGLGPSYFCPAQYLRPMFQLEHYLRLRQS